jgi:hypothetical protein
MRTVRWSSVALGLVTLTVLAVLGGVWDRMARGRTSPLRSPWIDAFVTRVVGPFDGGFREPVQTQAVLAWGLGLLVALLVLAVTLAVASRAGSSFATIAGGWLGSILGCGLGGFAATLVVLADFLGDGGQFSQQLAMQVYTSLTHGLYWGALVGWFVGCVALLGGVGTPRSR